MKARLSHAPLRLVTGGFILNSGLDHIGVDDQTAKQLHGMASGTYPFLSGIEASTFTRMLAGGEIALGAALLTPFVPAALAGAGLTAFSGGLLGLYLRTPGMRRGRGLRPTPEGLSLAKDSWMLGIGTTLTLDGLFAPSAKRARSAR